jgi:hypothetical protein
MARRALLGCCEADPPAVDAIEYERHWLRDRQPADAGSVSLWLAANNSTARDLALSIRDEGRANAFPILADALQDAGCAHPDLLDACRTGDPDIDGRWVLQVLLGDR